jgi:hypothetical protein
MHLRGEAVHRLRHTFEEKCLRLLLATVAIRCGYEFLGLGHGQRGEEVWEDGLQRATQPDVEEIRQVGVAYVVVVRRVGGDDLCIRHFLSSRIRLLYEAGCLCWNMLKRLCERFCDAINEDNPRSGTVSEWIALCKIPDHWNGLPSE